MIVVEEKKPVEDYEDGIHGIQVDGNSVGTVVKEGDNKYYHLDKSVKSEDYVSIPKSTYSPDGADCIVFETKMRITADTTGPTSFNIIYGKWSGMSKFLFCTVAGSNVLKLSDWRAGASTTLSVDDTGVKLGEWFTLRIENYTNSAGETIARVYINGINVGESTNAGVLGSASANDHLNSIVIKASNNIIGSFDLDDTYLGEDKMIVEESDIESEQPAETPAE